MGWSSLQLGAKPTSAELKRELFSWFESKGGEVLSFAKKGNVCYWTIKTIDGRKTAGVTALRVFDGQVYEKTMDEDVHPYYYDISTRALDDLDPPASEDARRWREECRKRAALRNIKVPQGTMVRFLKPVTFGWREPKTATKHARYRRRWLWLADDGGYLRISDRQVKEWIVNGTVEIVK